MRIYVHFGLCLARVFILTIILCWLDTNNVINWVIHIQYAKGCLLWLLVSVQYMCSFWLLAYVDYVSVLIFIIVKCSVCESTLILIYVGQCSISVHFGYWTEFNMKVYILSFCLWSFFSFYLMIGVMRKFIHYN